MKIIALIYTVDHLTLFYVAFMENSIGLKRVNNLILLYFCFVSVISFVQLVSS